MADDLELARAKRWWQSGRPIARIDRAARFVDDVGFALLFPKAGVELPSLWRATTDRTPSEGEGDWGPDMDRVWRWKDELPRRGLSDLFPRAGEPGDFDESAFSPDAHRIARILLLDGPQSTAVLREALDVEGSRGAERFGKAVGELARVFVVTNFGTKDEGHSWPSAVLELTTRVFTIPKHRNLDASRLNAARTFLDTMLVAQPYHLGNAFHGGATRLSFLRVARPRPPPPPTDPRTA